jgi:hypothetical protein
VPGDRSLLRLFSLIYAAYNFDDVPGDMFLQFFNIAQASNIFLVIRDIRSVNP